MCNQKNPYQGERYTPTSRVYEYARESFSKTHTGYEYSDESRMKMSNSAKGKIISDAVRKKISDTLNGRIISPEWRKKISESSKGKIKTEKHKQSLRVPKSKPNWRKGLTGTHSVESTLKMKKNQPTRREILQIDITNGAIIKEWFSISDAVRQYGSGPSHCVNGYQKTSKGFKWKYKYDKEN